MKNTIRHSFLLILAIMPISILIAQPGVPPATPIDGGLSWLLAAGTAYGIRKWHKSKK